jgi:hypothetical protein
MFGALFHRKKDNKFEAHGPNCTATQVAVALLEQGIDINTPAAQAAINAAIKDECPGNVTQTGKSFAVNITFGPGGKIVRN